MGIQRLVRRLWTGREAFELQRPRQSSDRCSGTPWAPHSAILTLSPASPNRTIIESSGAMQNEGYQLKPKRFSTNRHALHYPDDPEAGVAFLRDLVDEYDRLLGEQAKGEF